MPGEIATTKRQREIMRHALGLNNGGRDLGRNHFATGPGCNDYEVCMQLVDLGLMVARRVSWVPDILFMVTDAGKAEL